MVMKRLKSLFVKERGLKTDELQKLASLEGQERADELHALLYEYAFQNAARFVHDELRRHESPMKDLQRHLFFNEMLVINFWMVEKVFLHYLGSLAVKMHSHYFGTLPDIDERTVALQNRIKTYNLCWDEFTGHHDEFGLKVGEQLFTIDAEFPVKQVSFWIISYVDDSLKSFRSIRKQLLDSGLIHRKENGNG